MSMCDLVNKAPKILQEIELLKLTQVGEFENSEDPEYEKGEFVFADYLARRKNLPDDHFSEPIQVEGILYKFEFYPSGIGDGKGTHISACINRRKLVCLNLDTSDKVFNTMKMLHSSDRQKNFR